MMTAVLRWVRTDLRHRRAAAVGLAVLVAIATVVPLTAAAATRRTASSLDRMRDELKPYHADVQFESEEPPPADAQERIRSLPGVEAAGVGAVVMARPVGSGLDFAESWGQGPRTPETGIEIDRLRLDDGRLPNAADEVVLGARMAALLAKGVGDRVELETFTWDGIEAAWMGERLEFDGPRVELEVVGVGDGPEGVTGADVVNVPSFVLADAFFDAWEGDMAFFDGIHLVRLEDGPGAGAEFEQAVQQAFPDRTDVSVNLSQEDDRVAGAIDAQTIGLLLLTLVSAVAAAVAVGQAVSRHVSRSDADLEVLASLGASRRERQLAGLASVSAPVSVGAACAAVGSVIASRWFPTGTAGRVEPAPGVRVDVVVLGGAALVLLLVTVAGAALGRRGAIPARPSRLLDAVAVAALPVTVSTGVRAALQGGRGRRGAPVRAPLIAAVAGVAGVVASLVFGASLDRLVDTPARYGFNFDVAVGVGDELSDDEAWRSAQQVAEEPWVEAAVLARINNVFVEGRETYGFGLRPLGGDVNLTVVEGRPVEADGEVVLGGRTMDELDVEVGDTVSAAGADGSDVELRVVGQALFPTVENEDPALGMAVTMPTYDRLEEIDQGFPELYVDLADGVSVASVRADLEQYGFITEGWRPAVVGNLDGVSSVPYAVAAFLAVLATVAVSHALVTVVRRRRSELALLKTFGLERRGLAVSVAVQAMVFAAVGLGVGVPVGLVIGGRAWQAVTGGLGLPGDALAPVSVALVLPATVLLLLAVAAAPARAAAHTPAGEMLRAE